MLKVDHLTFSYSRHLKSVFKDISFHIPKGELCALFGPNGTGKTTLFKCCLKLLAPDNGSVRINGNNIRRLKVKEMARHVAYVPQAHQCAFPYNVGQMVIMGRTPHLSRFFTSSNRDINIARQAMETIGIAHLSEIPFNQLSGGQQQMVLIARAIAQDTGLILLDEPAAALDFKNQISLWQILQDIAGRGTAILACTHDPNHVAWFCHSTMVLNESGLLAKGSPEQVMDQEMMDRIYEDTCNVRDVDKFKIMVPKRLTKESADIVTAIGNRKGNTL